MQLSQDHSIGKLEFTLIALLERLNLYYSCIASKHISVTAHPYSCYKFVILVNEVTVIENQ